METVSIMKKTENEKMSSLEKRYMEKFKNHVATFNDFGIIKVIDFKAPKTSDYRIRFMFEEDYCRLHISGDLGELIATNYYNMTFEKFSAFVNNVGYFEEKINCHSRAIHCFDEELARHELKDRIIEDRLLDDSNLYKEDEEEERIENVLDDVLEDYCSKTGIGNNGYDVLSELDEEAWDWCYDLGKKETGILGLYMTAFKLATKQLKEKEIIK